MIENVDIFKWRYSNFMVKNINKMTNKIGMNELIATSPFVIVTRKFWPPFDKFCITFLMMDS